MKLTTVHQLLIVGAITLGAIYALRSLWMFSRTGNALEIAMGGVGAVLAVLGALYLRRFRSKLQAPVEETSGVGS